jgi:hypothetical protein
MPDKTIQDFPSLTDELKEDDVLYLNRGLGVDRDKKTTGNRVIPTVDTENATTGIDLGTFFGDLIIFSTPPSADIILTLSNNLPSGRKLTIINKSPTYSVKLAGSSTEAAHPGKTLRLISDGSSLIHDPDYSAIKTVTDAGYTILDDDGFDVIRVSTGASDRTVTLPTLADNVGRSLTIMKLDYGLGDVIVDGEGSETINGVLTKLLSRPTDTATIIADEATGEWKVLSFSLAEFNTGWVNRSLWTSKTIGSVTVAYDNLSGGPFQLGETVTETGGSGATGVIVFDSGVSLWLANVGNGGVFTNDNVITGSISGATADVNHPIGNNKNIDNNTMHHLSTHLPELEVRLFINSTGVDTGCIEIQSEIHGTTAGYSIHDIDSDNDALYSATSGLQYIDSAYTLQTINTDDWYYKIVITRRYW